MEHQERTEKTEIAETEEPILENCSSKKGLARFRCNAIQAVQIVFFIFVAMIFMVIALDTGTAEAKSSRNNPSVGVVVNPAFQYRFIYERELKSVIMERTNKVRGARVKINLVMKGKDKPAFDIVIRKLNFSLPQKTLLRRRMVQHVVTPFDITFAKFVNTHPSLLESFQEILRDRNGIAVIPRKSKYMNIAKIMGLRVIPVRQIKRDQVLHSSAADNLR